VAIDRAGGILVLIGTAFTFVAVVAAAAGLAVGLGRTDPAGLAVDVAMACVGVGALLLGLAGDPPLDRRATRIGLLGLGVGLLAVGASAILAGTSTTDPLASLPIVVLTVAGFCLVPIGLAITAIALLVDGGRSRLVGAALVVGMIVAVVALAVRDQTGMAGILPAAAFLLIASGAAGIGLLAVTGARAPR
jgi:hypothetical protein